MAEVNFLPQDQIQNKKLQATSGKLRFIVAIFGVICLAIGIGGSAYIIYKTKSVSELEKKQNELKSEILAQEQTEQTFVYLKDRLHKISDIVHKHPNNALFLAQKAALDTFPPDSSLKQLSLSDSDSTFAITAPDVISLSSVIDQMKTPAFAKGYIDSISYNPGIGYQLKFILK